MTTRGYINPFDKRLDNQQDFNVINLSKIWRKEFLPIIKTPNSLQILHECMLEYIEDHCCELFFDSNGQIVPWATHSKELSTYAFRRVRHIIHRKALKGDPEAKYVWDSFLIYIKQYSKADEWDKHRDIFWNYALLFGPKISQPSYWAPESSCHYISRWMQYLVKQWKPTLDWRIVLGDEHSTVVSIKGKMIIDILLYKKMSSKQILEFTREPLHYEQENKFIVSSDGVLIPPNKTPINIHENTSLCLFNQ